MISFKNILIPVDEGIDTTIAIKKALELKENNGGLCIHLIYCDYEEYFPSFLDYFKKQTFLNWQHNANSIEKRVKLIDEEIKSQFLNCEVVVYKLPQRNFSKGVIKYIKTNNVDLFLYCKKETRHLTYSPVRININKIAKNTSCVILAVTPGCISHPIRSILLPVGSSVSKKKNQLAIGFAQKYNGFIHLVTMLDQSEEAHSKKNADVFYETYKLLQECGYAPHYKILSNVEDHETLLNYAEEVNADMILLNPRKGSIFSRIFYKPVTEFVHPLSSLHILIISL